MVSVTEAGKLALFTAERGPLVDTPARPGAA
jgi:hypothetical protein